MSDAISIETRIPEFGNPDITHNVEFSLHPIFAKHTIQVEQDGKSLTANRLLRLCASCDDLGKFTRVNKNLLSRGGILRNACTIAQNDDSVLVATLTGAMGDIFDVSITQQSRKPYAIVECKRVGVEEGAKKGPQTIEKAKQGAYVARTVSSLQKVRLEARPQQGIEGFGAVIRLAHLSDRFGNH